MPDVKGYHAALNLVFSLAGKDLVAQRIISRMFSSFEKIRLVREVKHQNAFGS